MTVGFICFICGFVVGFLLLCGFENLYNTAFGLGERAGGSVLQGHRLGRQEGWQEAVLHCHQVTLCLLDESLLHLKMC